MGLAIKLFERRKPSLKKGLIKDSDLETLYQEEDNFLNDSFFKEVLRIPIVERQLFFRFVESKDLEADFLQEENHFLLIDNLLNLSLIYNMQYIENK